MPFQLKKKSVKRVIDILPRLLNNESSHCIELSKLFYKTFYGRNLNSTNHNFNILLEYRCQGLLYRTICWYQIGMHLYTIPIVNMPGHLVLYYLPIL